MADFTINKDLVYCTVTSPTYGDRMFIVDLEDLELIKKNKWGLQVAKTVSTGFYVRNSKGVLLHALLLNPPKGMVVDHINRNTFDNRRKNLRIVTRGENAKNRGGYGAIAYKYMSRNNARKGHNQSYTVKFPLQKTKTFCDINKAKAYYIECLINKGV